MQRVAIPDVLDAIERNTRAMIIMAGEKAGSITVTVDTISGTASIHHTRNIYSNAIDCNIRLPAMRAQAFLTRDELDRWIGYFLHELCHALYTDSVAWKVACAERIQNVVNGLEDVRIEREFNKRAVVANSFELLNALLAFVVSELTDAFDPNDMTNIAWTLAMVGRVELCGYSLPGALPHIAKLNPAMRALVDRVMVKLDAAQNTMDVVEIVRELQSEITAKPETETPEGAKVNPGRDTDEGEGEGEGEGGGEGEGEGEAGTGEAGDKPEGAYGRGTGGETVEDEAGDIRGKGGNASKPEGDLTQAKPVDLRPVDEKQKADSGELARTGQADAEGSIIESIRKAQKNTNKPLTPIKEASRNALNFREESMKAAKLRAQVARVLKAEESEAWERGRASGRLDRFAIARIGAGHVENVYAKRTISSGYETEIDILVDASSSMSGSPMRAASVFSYVVAQAAQQVGVRCQVSVFSSDYFAPRVVKTASESLSAKSVEKRFQTLTYGTDGSTPLTSAIVSTAARLASRAPSKRKLIFVVSDGGCDDGPLAVRKACEYAERLDIETVALCIDIPPHKGFRHAVQCNSGNIAEAGLGALVRVLTREA